MDSSLLPKLLEQRCPICNSSQPSRSQLHHHVELIHPSEKIYFEEGPKTEIGYLQKPNLVPEIFVPARYPSYEAIKLITYAAPIVFQCKEVEYVPLMILVCGRWIRKSTWVGDLVIGFDWDRKRIRIEVEGISGVYGIEYKMKKIQKMSLEKKVGLSGAYSLSFSEKPSFFTGLFTTTHEDTVWCKAENFIKDEGQWLTVFADRRDIKDKLGRIQEMRNEKVHN